MELLLWSDSVNPRFMLKTTLPIFFLLLTALKLLLACTIAVFSPSATSYGRSILFKTRDVPRAEQTYMYVDGPIPFIGVTYVDQLSCVYAGVNAAGFGIVNTDTYNHGPWRGSGITDGELMYIALSRCRTVWDFMDILDSLIYDSVFFAATHCYGVIDQYGNAGMVEVGSVDFVYYSALSSRSGFLVRTNFSLSGDLTIRPGMSRYIRARALAERYSPIDCRSVYNLISDLATINFIPYPLPFEDTVAGLPFGHISTFETINRFTTKTYQIIVGRLAGDGIEYPFMFSGFGQPFISMPAPLWVFSKTIPPQLSGINPPLREFALSFVARAYDTPFDWVINTFVADSIHSALSSVRDSVFAMVDDSLSEWREHSPDTSMLASFQQYVADMIERHCRLLSERLFSGESRR